MKKYTIELTKAEYVSILKAVYLGAWMANAHRIDVKEEYEAAQKLMLSLAPQFDSTEYVNPDKSKGIYPSLKLEMGEPEILRTDYNKATFESELATLLGTRHFAKRYSEDEILKMSEKDHFEKLHHCIDLYTDEIEEFGISRISFPDLED